MAEIEQTSSEDTQDQVEEFVAVAAEPEDDAVVTVDADADDEELVESEDSLTYSNGVIEKIVAMATREVPHVLGMKGNLMHFVQEQFGAETLEGDSPCSGNCGQKLADGAKFCPSCGSPVAGSAPASAPAPVPAPVYLRLRLVMAVRIPLRRRVRLRRFLISDELQPVRRPDACYAAGRHAVVPIQADRSLPMWIILSIVTCGIYSWFFLYELARDMNVMCQNDGETTPGLAQFILLSIVTCGFYAYWWYYKIGNRMQTNAPRYGLQFQENSTTILMWQIVSVLLCGLGPIFAMNIIIKNTNAMAAAYNARMGA